MNLLPPSLRALAAALSLPLAAVAQTGDWNPDTAAAGLGGQVFTFATWQGSVYAGGYPFSANGGLIHSLARWDGSRWLPVGTGVALLTSFFDDPAVRALCEYQGDLIVAGTFDRAGGVSCNNIARWDGTAFHPLGSGLVEIGWDADVRALCVFNNELYAAGTFDLAGGQTSNGIARWNGSSWSPCGSGCTLVGGGTGSGKALLVSGTQLFLGGSFDRAGGVTAANIARWNGTTFQPVGSGLDSQVFTLAEHGGQVHTGGAFGSTGSTWTGATARWNGTAWVGLLGNNAPSSPVTCLCSHAGRLYAGGAFSAPGANVGAWDGVQWLDIGGVAGIFSGTIGTIVLGLHSTPSGLLVGGQFTRAGQPPYGAPAIVSAGVALYDGSAWRTVGHGLGLSGVAARVLPYRNGWLAVGNFGDAGEAMVTHCAFYDGDRWSRLATFDADLLDAVVWNGDLIVSGSFQSIDGQPIARMARWNGTAWSQFGPGITVPMAVHQGQLFVGGTNQLRRWNGSAFVAVATASGIVDDLHVHKDGNLYFTTATFNQMGVWRWNGTAAAQIGTPNNFTTCLGSYGQDLVVAGRFTSINGAPMNLLARWNGTAWSGMGLSAASYSVDATCELDGQLYIGINGGSTGFVQRWTGSAWQGLGSGLGGVPQCLFADRATASVHAFGTFFNAGALPVWNYAEWRNQPRWRNRLHGLAGAAGVPLLRGTGTLLAGSPFTLTIEAPANHLAVLALGLARIDQPLFGGLLLPSPDTLPLLLGDAQGVSSFAATWPALVPAGLGLFAQAWLLDASGPQGWTATNTLQCTTP